MVLLDKLLTSAVLKGKYIDIALGEIEFVRRLDGDNKLKLVMPFML